MLAVRDVKMDFSKFMEIVHDMFQEKILKHGIRLSQEGLKDTGIMEHYFIDKIPSLYPGKFIKKGDKWVLRSISANREKNLKMLFRYPLENNQINFKKTVHLLNFLQICNTYLLLIMVPDPKEITPEELVVVSSITVLLFHKYRHLFQLAQGNLELASIYSSLITPILYLVELTGNQYFMNLAFTFILILESIMYTQVTFHQVNAFLSLIPELHKMNLGSSSLDAVIELLKIEGHLPLPTNIQRNFHSPHTVNFTHILLSENKLLLSYRWNDAIFLGKLNGKYAYLSSETFSFRKQGYDVQIIGFEKVKIMDANFSQVRTSLSFRNIEILPYLLPNLPKKSPLFVNPFHTLVVNSKTRLDIEEAKYVVQYDNDFSYVIHVNSLSQIPQLHEKLTALDIEDIFLV